MSNTLRDLLPDHIRRWVYALLAIVVQAIAVIVAVLADGWQATDLVIVVTSLVSSAGFGMAASNIPASASTPRDRGEINTVVSVIVSIVLLATAAVLALLALP